MRAAPTPPDSYYTHLGTYGRHGDDWHEPYDRETLVRCVEVLGDELLKVRRNNAQLLNEIDRNNIEIAGLKGYVPPEAPEPKRTMRDTGPVDWARVAAVKTGSTGWPWRLEFDGAEIWHEIPYPRDGGEATLRLPAIWSPMSFATKRDAEYIIADRAAGGQLTLDVA